MFDEVKPAIVEVLHSSMREGMEDPYQLQQAIRRVIGRWVNNTHRRRPMIIPVVGAARMLTRARDIQGRLNWREA